MFSKKSSKQSLTLFQGAKITHVRFIFQHPSDWCHNPEVCHLPTHAVARNGPNRIPEIPQSCIRVGRFDNPTHVPQNNHQKGLRGSLPHVLSPGAILLDFFGRIANKFVDGKLFEKEN